MNNAFQLVSHETNFVPRCETKQTSPLFSTRTAGFLCILKRILDDPFEHLFVDVREPFDVKAAYARCMLAKLREQFGLFRRTADHIKRHVLLSRRKAGHHPVEFAAVRIRDLITAVTDDRRAPHLRLESCQSIEHLENTQSVRTAFGIFDRVQKIFNARIRFAGLRFVLCHSEEIIFTNIACRLAQMVGARRRHGLRSLVAAGLQTRVSDSKLISSRRFRDIVRASFEEFRTMRDRMFGIFIMMIAALLFPPTISPQAAGSKLVTFKNSSRTPVKVCLYKDVNKTYPFALKCMTLAPGAAQVWDQGKVAEYDVFAFDPGIIDVLRCSFMDLTEFSVVEVFDKEKNDLRCVKPSGRHTVVRPTPKPSPSPIAEILRVCNTSIDEEVFFAITFALGQTNHMTEGWRSVKKNECTNVDLSERWRLQGLPAQFRYKTYIYGETAGILGGAVKKVWEGDDPKLAFCINDDKTRQFGNKQQEVTEDAVLWESDCTPAAGKRMVKMWPVTVPKLGDPWKWNF